MDTIGPESLRKDDPALVRLPRQSFEEIPARKLDVLLFHPLGVPLTARHMPANNGVYVFITFFCFVFAFSLLNLYLLFPPNRTGPSVIFTLGISFLLIRVLGGRPNRRQGKENEGCIFSLILQKNKAGK